MNSKFNAIMRSPWLSPVVGGLMGLVFFLCVFGSYALNPCHVDWIIGGGDLAQHYLGWAFFRNGDWRFPVGLTDQLCYPHTASVVFTDSIPWLAVFFKCFSAWLPAHFQYLGLYMLVCYVLQGAVGAMLVRRLTGNNGVACLGAMLFVLSPVLMFRSFAHIALCSHYIILISFLLYLSDRERPRLWPWCLLMAWAAGVHFMFVPMVAVVMLGSAVREGFANRKLWRPLLRFMATCLTAGTTAWLMGGFTADVSRGGYTGSDLGYYSMNLNALVNCTNDTFSRFLHPLPCARDGQWEGFAYLGMGLIVGLAVCVPLLLCKVDWRKRRLDALVVCGIMLVFIVLALSPTITFNRKVLCEVPTLKPWRMLLGVFRSSGRFAWPLVYLAMSGVVAVLWRCLRRPALRWAALALVVCLQVADFSGWMLQKSHRVEAAEVDLASSEAMLDGKQRICYCRIPYGLSDEAGLLLVAADKKMELNLFYFARLNGLCNQIVEEAVVERDHSPQANTFYID